MSLVKQDSPNELTFALPGGVTLTLNVETGSINFSDKLGLNVETSLRDLMTIGVPTLRFKLAGFQVTRNSDGSGAISFHVSGGPTDFRAAINVDNLGGMASITADFSAGVEYSGVKALSADLGVKITNSHGTLTGYASIAPSSFIHLPDSFVRYLAEHGIRGYSEGPFNLSDISVDKVIEKFPGMLGNAARFLNHYDENEAAQEQQIIGGLDPKNYQNAFTLASYLDAGSGQGTTVNNVQLQQLATQIQLATKGTDQRYLAGPGISGDLFLIGSAGALIDIGQDLQATRVAASPDGTNFSLSEFAPDGKITSSYVGGSDFNVSLNDGSIEIDSGSKGVINGNHDTIVANAGGSVTINGGANTVDLLSSAATTVRFTDGAIGEIINVDGVRLGSNLASDGDNYWTDGSAIYHFVPHGDGENIGKITISDAGDSIEIDNFNLSDAEWNSGNSSGIFIPPTISIARNPAADGVELHEGAAQSFTVALSVTKNVAQNAIVHLAGSDPSCYRISTGADLLSFSPDGTVTVTIPAGQDSVTLALVNISNAGQSSNLQLTASLASSSADGHSISAVSDVLDVSYVAAPIDPFADPTNLTAITGSVRTSNSANLTYTVYSGDDGNDLFNVSSGTNPNSILLGNGSSVINDFASGDVIGGADNIVRALSGSGYVLEALPTGDGNNVIQLHGNNDAVVAGDGNNRIYADTETDLPTAIQHANSETASNQQGAFLGAGDGDNTLVGGAGNDLIMTGEGHNLIVLGAGSATVFSGYEVSGAASDWSTANNTMSGTLTTNHVTWTTGTYTAPSNYEGNRDAHGDVVGTGDDTIFAGSGAAVIQLSNGNNYVDLGTGNSSVYGGMGQNTIFGGSGDVFVEGGGGDDYIDGEAGNDLLEGRGGNNTIIGGSGQDTIYAGGSGAGYATDETGNNYVEGGSGDDFIYGSGGNDTLIAGSGNTTIQGGSGNEYIEGGSGNDSLIASGGNDTIDAGGNGNDTLGATDGNVTIYGGGGTDLIIGGAGTNVLYSGDGGTADSQTSVIAGSGTTVIYGGAGHNQLFGGTGSDTIYGGLGTTLIEGGTSSDVIYAGDGGTAGLPTTVLAGTGAATLYGGAGSDILNDSLGGADVLIGGTGDETLVGTGSDTITAGSGDDFLQSLGGKIDFKFNPDFGDDTIVGISGGDTLEFADGTEVDDLTITAQLFSDGSEGVLISSDEGGSIAIDNALSPGVVGQIIFDDPQTLPFGQLILQDGVSQTLQGAAGNLVFDVSNADSILGGLGHDTISAWGNNDTISAAALSTLLDAEGSGDSIYAGVGNDSISSEGANNTLYASTGNTIFSINDASDLIIGFQGDGDDTVLSSVSYVLPEFVDILTLEGAHNLTATGNAEHDVITGNSGNDTLIAGSGGDTLVSGSGIDTLVTGGGGDTLIVNNTADVIQKGGYDGGYYDTVKSSVDYHLTTYLSNIALTGSSNLKADAGTFSGVTITANSGNDLLSGSGSNDIFITGSGIDTIVSGSYGATFYVNNTKDVIRWTPAASYYYASVLSSVDYALGSNLNYLTLTGTANLVGTGNSGDDRITGNAGNDTLIAGSGNDTLLSGTGIDTFVSGTGNDVFYGQSGDTYQFGSRFGHDEISQQSGNDTIIFSGISDPGVLNIRAVSGYPGASLVLSNGASSVQLDGEFSGVTTQFQFHNGRTYSLDQVLAMATVSDSTIAGANGSFLLNGDAGASVSGGSGNDTIIGTADSDTLVAGGINLNINGGDELIGEGNRDLLIGSINRDTLIGSGSDDTLVAGAGENTLVGGSGTQTYVLTAGGITTIEPGSNGASALLYLPQGQSLSNYQSYRDGQNLIVQSLDGSTTAVLSGYFSSVQADNIWYISSDNDNPELLSTFQIGSPTSETSYQSHISQLATAASATLAEQLSQLGREGHSLGALPDASTGYLDGGSAFAGTAVANYEYGGLTVTNTTVSGGLYFAPSSDLGGYSTATTEQQFSRQIPIYAEVPSAGGRTYQATVLLQSQLNSAGQIAGYETLGLYLPTDGFTASAAPLPAGTEVVGLSDITSVDGGRGLFETATATLQIGSTPREELTGYQTIYLTQQVSSASENQSLVLQNIVGDGGNDLISSEGPFSGTVKTGNGNVSVNLGGLGEDWLTGTTGGYSYDVELPNDTGLSTKGALSDLYAIVPGAFIEAGSGNDYIVGTSGDDTVAAGTGFDTMDGGRGGDTYYVPLTGISTDIINDSGMPNRFLVDDPGYGGTSPIDTLVLPQGISISDLKYRVFKDPDNGNESYLQLSYGNASVLVAYENLDNVLAGYFGGVLPGYLDGLVSLGPTAGSLGVDRIQFASGETYSIADLLARVTLSANDFNPVVESHSLSVNYGQSIAASGLLAASDTPDNPITYYKITDSGSDGGSFSLNGQVQAAGASFLVGVDELSELTYTGGSQFGDDSITVSAFDGAVWSADVTDDIVTDNSATTLIATGPNQSITAPAGSSSTLVGKYAGDSLSGGNGNTAFIVDDPSVVVSDGPNGGTDTIYSSVSYTLPENVDNLVLTGSADLTGTANGDNDVITANSGNDTLNGGVGNDTLIAGSGNDDLMAGTGATTLVGGSGLDVFGINSTSDVLELQPNSQNDTIESSISYSLDNSVNNLTLTGTADLLAQANDNGDQLVGNAGNSTLIGGAGNDTLVAGTGPTTLVAGGGNDVLVINNANDTLQNLTANDTVESSVSLTLPDAVDALVLTGSDNLVATGNSGNDSITANAGNDTLIAGSGIDTLVAGSGNDTLIGAAGDTYALNGRVGNVEIESGAGGTFDFGSGIDVGYLTGKLVSGSDGQPALVLQGLNYGGSGTLTIDDAFDAGAPTFAFADGTRDTLEQLLSRINLTASSVTGATGNVVFDSQYEGSIVGGAGNDTLYGSGFIETIAGGDGNQQLYGLGYYQTLIGGAGNDTLTAGVGNDTLIAGSGLTTLVGGSGNDVFVVNNTDDVVQVIDHGGRDTIQSSVDFRLPSNVDALTLTGSDNLTAYGNDDATNVITGNSGNDTLISGLGLTTLRGGAGNDIFVVHNSGDVIVEPDSAAGAAIYSDVNYVLPNNVNTIYLIGSNDLSVTGNYGDDQIFGNSGSDTLIAGSGNDTLYSGTGPTTMIGGSGTDSFDVKNAADQIILGPNSQNDTIDSSVSFTLSDASNTLILNGADNLTATGNDNGDLLVGNDGNSTLVGGSGNDVLASSNGATTTTMIGGGGADNFVVKNSGDSVIESANSVGALVVSYVDYVAPQNVNELILQTPGNLIATANDAGDVLIGTGGSDAFFGKSGTDTVYGGGGNSFIAMGAGNDFIQSDALNNVVAENVGDGQDFFQGTANAANTISIGGGTDYSQISLSRNGDDLVVTFSPTDSITLGGWYYLPELQDVATLQIIEGASTTYDPNSSNVLDASKIETFDFKALVSQFDRAVQADPSITSWSISSNALMDLQNTSDTAALGGQAAYNYAMSDGEGFDETSVLGASNFGLTSQSISSSAFKVATVNTKICYEDFTNGVNSDVVKAVSERLGRWSAQDELKDGGSSSENVAAASKIDDKTIVKSKPLELTLPLPATLTGIMNNATTSLNIVTLAEIQEAQSLSVKAKLVSENPETMSGGSVRATVLPMVQNTSWTGASPYISDGRPKWREQRDSTTESSAGSSFHDALGHLVKPMHLSIMASSDLNTNDLRLGGAEHQDDEHMSGGLHDDAMRMPLGVIHQKTLGAKLF